MAITDQNVTSFIRSLVGEATAKYWTDAEITLYKQFAMSKVQAELYPWLWPQYKSVADFAMVINVADTTAPTDCFKVSHFQVKESGLKLRQIEEDEYFNHAAEGTGLPRAWTWAGGKIKLMPTPNITDADYLIVWYMKCLDEITDWPDSCRAYIAIEAAMLARGKNQEITADFMDLRKLYRDAAMIDLTMSSAGQIVGMHDFSESDSLA